MSGETQVVLAGNLTGDIELTATPSGAMVANFTVATTPRTFDKQAGEWRDGTTLFMPCNLWRQQAENAAESEMKRGTRVLVTGTLRQRSFEHNGQKRTVVECDVDEIGPSCKHATVKVNKVSRNGSGSSAHGSSGSSGGAPADDPWASSPDSDQAPF